MKIEMGESLVVSWLKHIKGCQLVQGNWKPSQEWIMLNVDDVTDIINKIDSYFKEKFSADFNYVVNTELGDTDWAIFKQNASIDQVLAQGESDAVGLSYQDGIPYPYSVEVAFHSNGLNYGNAKVTTMKVLEKLSRSAISLYGYMGFKQGEIVFASPKINNNIMKLLEPAIGKLQELLHSSGLNFTLRIVYGEKFKTVLLDPIINVANNVRDTSELFMRAYQLYSMFYENDTVKNGRRRVKNKSTQVDTNTDSVDISVDLGAWKEFKVGQLANIKLRQMLENEAASVEEIASMQNEEYSKEHFGLNFPLLKKVTDDKHSVRYYAKPLEIYGDKYYMCSQWFEVPNNNDRPFLEKWIALHE